MILFFKLWTITPSSTDANENDSLFLSEWIVLMFLMHPCTSMAVGATIGVDCLGPAAFSLMWRGRARDSMLEGREGRLPSTALNLLLPQDYPRPGLFGGLALIQQRQRLTSAAAALRAPRKDPSDVRDSPQLGRGGWLGRWGCLKVS